MTSHFRLRSRQLNGSARVFCTWLSVWSFSNLALVPLGFAGPSGENVINGDVAIAREGAITTIRASDRSIIEFQQFDVGVREGVEFIQPDAGSRVLNRILGADPTRIDGTLTANGQVFIVNRAGIVFGRSATIDVGGLIAAAGSISNADFLNNGDIFTELSGPVANFGQIDAERVALLGKSVENAGAISAPGGVIALVAADSVYLTQQGSDVVVKLPNPEASLRVVDPGGNGRGVIVADDSSLTVGDLQAFAMGDPAESAAALSPGDVAVSGSLDVASDTGIGGQISLRGTNVSVDQAELDASGAAGGGRILLGGERSGQVGPNADRVFVGDSARLAADARQAGDGGEIVVFAEGDAIVRGDLTARGGPLSGNGGFIETSGRRFLEVTRAPDLSAPAGDGGEWLLDPIDIEIFNGANEPSEESSGSSFVSSFFRRSRLDVRLINASLARRTSVTIFTSGSGTQAGTITQNADARISFQPIGQEGPPRRGALSLIADNDIILNAGIEAFAPLDVTLAASRDIMLNGSVLTSGGVFLGIARGTFSSFATLDTRDASEFGRGVDIVASAISIQEPVFSGGDLRFASSDIDVFADVSAAGLALFQSFVFGANPNDPLAGEVELGSDVALRAGSRLEVQNSRIVLGAGGTNRFEAPVVVLSDLFDLRDESDSDSFASFQIDATRAVISSVDIGGDGLINIKASDEDSSLVPFLGLGLDLGVDDDNDFAAGSFSLSGPGLGGSGLLTTSLAIFSPITTRSGDLSIQGFDSVGIFASLEAARNLSIAQVTEVGIGGSASLAALAGDLTVVDGVGRIQLEAGNSRSSNPSSMRQQFFDDPSQQLPAAGGRYTNEFRAGGDVALAPIARGVYTGPEPEPTVPAEPVDGVTHDVVVDADGTVDLARIDLRALELSPSDDESDGGEGPVVSDHGGPDVSEMDGVLTVHFANDPDQADPDPATAVNSRLRDNVFAESIELSSDSGAGAIDLDANVDLTATGGDIAAIEGISSIGLLGGADSANIVMASGDVDLAPVVGTGGADLIVKSGASAELRGVDVTGQLSVQIDTLDTGGVQSLDAGPLVASSLTLGGQGNDDLFSFSGASRTRSGGVQFGDAGAISLDTGASITSAMEIGFGDASPLLTLGAGSLLDAGTMIDGSGLAAIEVVPGAEPARISAQNALSLATVREAKVTTAAANTSKLELSAGSLTLSGVSGLDRLLISLDAAGLGTLSSLNGSIVVGSLTIRSDGGMALLELADSLELRATKGALTANDGIAELRLLGGSESTHIFSAATSLALGPISSDGSHLILMSGEDLSLASLDSSGELDARFGTAGQGSALTASGMLRAADLSLRGAGTTDSVSLMSTAAADVGDVSILGVGATTTQGDLMAARSLVVGADLALTGSGAQMLASGTGEIALGGDTLKTTGGPLTLAGLTLRFSGALEQQLRNSTGDLLVSATIGGTPSLLTLGGANVALQGVQLDGALAVEIDPDSSGSAAVPATSTATFMQDVSASAIRVSSTGDPARVELGAGVDLMASSGSIDLVDGLSEVALTGAAGTANQLLAPMGSISLGPLTGSAGAGVTLRSGADTTLASVNLSGTFSSQFGLLGGGSSLSSMDILSASSVQIAGSVPADSVVLGGDLTAGLGGLAIMNVGSVSTTGNLSAVGDVALGSDVLLSGAGMQRLESVMGTLALSGDVTKTTAGDLALDGLQIVLNGPGTQLVSVNSGSLILGADVAKVSLGDLSFDAPVIEFSDPDDRADLTATTVAGLFANQVTGARSSSLAAQQGSVLLNGSRTRGGTVQPTLISTGNLSIDSAGQVTTGATEVFAVNGALTINGATGVNLPDTVALGPLVVNGGTGPIVLLGTAPTASFSVPVLSPSTGINVLAPSVSFTPAPQLPAPAPPGFAPVVATPSGAAGVGSSPSAGISALLNGDPTQASFGGGAFAPFGTNDPQEAINIAAVTAGLAAGSPAASFLAGGFLPFADRSIALERPVTLDESLEWLECVLNEDCDPESEGFDDPRLKGDEKQKLKEMYAELFGRSRQLSDRRALVEILDAYRARPDAADQVDPNAFLGFLRANPEESAVALRYLADLSGLVVQWRKAQEKTESIELGAACMLSNGLRLDRLEPSEVYAIVTGTPLTEPGLCPGGRR